MISNLPCELDFAIKNVYQSAGFKITKEPKREIESSEYEACRLGLNDYSIVFRVAKTTPNKIGQFVTLWKRPTPKSEIKPFDKDDNIDFVIINTSDTINSGQFIFNREILIAKNIMSSNNKGGKRAIRVYPPWAKPIAKEAIKTQQWQLKYFLYMSGMRADEALRKLLKR